jgi:hypothetical protein
MNLNVINSEVQIFVNSSSISNIKTNGTLGQYIQINTNGLFQGAVFSYAIENSTNSNKFSLIQ